MIRILLMLGMVLTSFIANAEVKISYDQLTGSQSVKGLSDANLEGVNFMKVWQWQKEHNILIVEPL